MERGETHDSGSNWELEKHGLGKGGFQSLAGAARESGQKVLFCDLGKVIRKRAAPCPLS